MREETLDAHSKRLRSLSASIDSSFLGYHRCFFEKTLFLTYLFAISSFPSGVRYIASKSDDYIDATRFHLAS
jgi:hypothetical protein